ncbi:WD40/YVTN/BNR-like repeat-containing protein [Nocardia goodfellowii]|uniref:Photosystem II stability/assembly factor-like uncharacterized protein n=1 Tax=Nocardia goodfellowii TaxID=882446 RepID=A0ABS4QRG0_9NOCA|nr:hypothetical protein [Nocardia goodfellowii]MBP2194301.1 photosystem II stability/assembly factor-like uncharacterized protein [Nocardia goodfellowii]
MKKRWGLIGLGTAVAIAAAIGITVVTTRPDTPTPPEFRPLSLTFISETEGWALGTIKGCATGQRCTALQHTTDAGRTWQPDASITMPPNTEVLRLADRRVGWAADLDDRLWSTNDGGATWQPLNAPGLISPRGAALSNRAIISGNRIQFVQSTSAGDKLELLTPTVDRHDWVTSSFNTGLPRTQSPLRVQIAHRGDTTWVWADGTASNAPAASQQSTEVGVSAKLDNGHWFPWTPPCPQPGRLLGLQASSDTDVIALCKAGPASAGEPWKTRNKLFISRDRGETFTEEYDAPAAGTATLVGTLTAGDLSISADGAILASHDGGQHWEQTYKTDSNAVTLIQADNTTVGYRTPGFVSPADGFAIEYNLPIARHGKTPEQEIALLATHDAGRSWARVAFTDVLPR